MTGKELLEALKAKNLKERKGKMSQMSQMNQFAKLDKLWKILRVALIDTHRVERDKDVVINMDQWFARLEGERCMVCMAGAVMWNRFIPECDEIFQRCSFGWPCDFPLAVENRLYAINELRLGKVTEAYCVIHNDYDQKWVEVEKLDLGREMPQYQSRKRAASNRRWWKAMGQLYRDLKRADI